MKIDGLTQDIIKQAFERTREASAYILDDIMATAIGMPREELSPYAPHIITTINTEKIRKLLDQMVKQLIRLLMKQVLKLTLKMMDAYSFAVLMLKKQNVPSKLSKVLPKILKQVKFIQVKL